MYALILSNSSTVTDCICFFSIIINNRSNTFNVLVDVSCSKIIEPFSNRSKIRLKILSSDVITVSNDRTFQPITSSLFSLQARAIFGFVTPKGGLNKLGILPVIR